MLTKDRVILALATRMQRSFNTAYRIKMLVLLLFDFLLMKIINLRNQNFGILTSQFACGSKQDSVYIFVISF